MESEILVRKARQGDKEALVQLIVSKQPDYYKLAYVYMRNQEDSLDALEDMIVILYENISKLKKDEAFFTWSKVILVNCCKRLLRRRKDLAAITEVKQEDYEADSFRQKDEQIVLESYLSRLSPKHQEVLRLRYFLDLDYESIAALVKVPVGTVKSRISLGLKQLRESLGGEMLG